MAGRLNLRRLHDKWADAGLEVAGFHDSELFKS